VYACSAVKTAATRTTRALPPSSCWKRRQTWLKRRALKRALLIPAAVAWSCAQLPCANASPLLQISLENSTYTLRFAASGGHAGFACGDVYGLVPSLPKRMSRARRCTKSSVARCGTLIQRSFCVALLSATRCSYARPVARSPPKPFAGGRVLRMPTANA
jgi:hypothetical protein